MSRVYVIVEGQTEESFVSEVLAPSLWAHDIFLTPRILGSPGHKGGNTNYDRVRQDIVVQLKQDRKAYCTTMLDLYGLGPGFPGMPPSAHQGSLEKVDHIEQAFKADIVAQMPELRPDVRFLPYVQLHEYEGLLFSDPDALASGIGQRRLAGHLRRFARLSLPLKTSTIIPIPPLRNACLVFIRHTAKCWMGRLLRAPWELPKSARSAGIAANGLKSSRHCRCIIERILSLTRRTAGPPPPPQTSLPD